MKDTEAQISAEHRLHAIRMFALRWIQEGMPNVYDNKVHMVYTKPQYIWNEKDTFIQYERITLERRPFYMDDIGYHWRIFICDEPDTEFVVIVVDHEKNALNDWFKIIQGGEKK